MNCGKKMIRMWKQNKEKMNETFWKKREEEYIICSGLRLQQLLMLNQIFRRSLKYISFNKAYEVQELASKKLFRY